MPEDGDVPRPFHVAGHKIEVRVWCPDAVVVNKMPPVPPKLAAKVPVTVVLLNPSDNEVILMVSNSCEVSDWTVSGIHGTGGYQSEPPEDICLPFVPTLTIPARSSIRFDDTVILDGWALKENGEYQLSYSYFGQVGVDTFVVHVVR